MNDRYEVKQVDCDDTNLVLDNINGKYIGIYIKESGIGYTRKIITYEEALRLNEWLSFQLKGTSLGGKNGRTS